MNGRTGRWIALSVFLVFAAMVIYFGFNPDDQARNKSIESPLDNQALQDEKEIIALLSAKFDIEEKSIRELLDRYKSAPKPDFKRTILDISGEYGLRKETVADIIIIYKVWAGKAVRQADPPLKTDEWDLSEK